MTVVNLYKNGNAVGPNPSVAGQEVHCYRLIAGEGKLLVKDDVTAPCIDIPLDDVNNWSEVDDPGKDASWDDIGRILAGEAIDHDD